jgi:hypothetical protein
MMPTHTVEAWRAALAAATPQVGERLQKYVNLAHPPELADFVMQHARAIAAAGSPDASPDSPRIVDQDALATWNLLLDGKIVLFVCSSPGLLNDEQAIELANIALTSDEMFDTKLLRRMLDQRLWPEEVPLEEVMRTLVIVESLPTAGRLAMMLLRFSKHPHPWIQSKTSKILGRCLESAEVVEDLFENADPRVRANLIEGVSLRERQPSFLPLVEKACRDQHHRVSSIALALRTRWGHETSRALIRMRTRSRDETVRKAAEISFAKFGEEPDPDPGSSPVASHVASDESVSQPDGAPANADAAPAASDPVADPAVAPAVAEVDQDPDSHPAEQPDPVLQS